MTTVHVPYTVEQDEDGVWCAHAWLGSSGGANGNGATADEAIADLREAARMVFDEDGIPAQLARSDGRATTVPVHAGQDVPKARSAPFSRTAG